MPTYSYHDFEFDEDETRRALYAAGLDRELEQNLILWRHSALIDPLHRLLEYSFPASDGSLEKWIAIANCQYRSRRDALATMQPPDGLAIYTNPFRLQIVMEWWRSGVVPVGPDLQKALSHAWILCEQDDTLDNPLIAEVIECFWACGFTVDANEIQAPQEPLKVYRGGLPHGIAWSTEFSVAKWFAERSLGPGRIQGPFMKLSRRSKRYWRDFRAGTRARWWWIRGCCRMYAEPILICVRRVKHVTRFFSIGNSVKWQ